MSAHSAIDLMASFFGYVLGSMICIIVSALVLAALWQIGHGLYDRMLEHAEAENRRILSIQIEHCLLSVRATDDPALLMSALCALLRDDSMISSAWLRAEYVKLKGEADALSRKG